MDRIERNKENVVAFYDLMFNQCQPREAIERYVPEHDVMLEREPLSALAADGQLAAYRHEGFWQPMDTPRELELLSALWDGGDAPWKVWDEI